MKTNVRTWLGAVAALALAGSLGCAAHGDACCDDDAHAKKDASCQNGSGKSCCDTGTKAQEKPATQQ